MAAPRVYERRQFNAAVVATGAIAWGAVARASEPERGSALWAGAAEVKVTPKAKGTFLIGPMKPSAGVHDDLFARALVIGGDKPWLAVITLDYLGFDRAYTDRLIRAAAAAANVPAQNVLLNCSHTHSAPLTAPWGPWREHRRESFYQWLPRMITEVTARAVSRMRPAKLRFCREPTQLGFNRRLHNGDKIVMAPNPQGAVVPWVDVLAVDEPDGRPIAVLFSHAAHPVIVHEASTLISGDYPGFAVQALNQMRGDGVVCLFAQGCSGNINGFPLKGGIDAAKAAGRSLAEAVARGLARGAAEIEAAKRRLVVAEPRLPLQAPPPPEEIRESLAKEKNATRRRRWAALLKIAERGQPAPIPMPIRGIAIGDFRLITMAHEPFAEYHHFIEKARPSKNAMVWGYTGGLECYVGTEKDYRLGLAGGYETSPRGAAFMFESRLPLAPQAEKVVQAQLRRVLGMLKPASDKRGK